MRLLPPSLRKRKRYIAFEIISDQPVEPEKVKEALNVSLLKLFGELESPEIRLIEFKDGKGMLMCFHDELNKVKIALTLIKKINGQDVIPVILGVAGTIKSCKRKYLEVLRNANSANGI